MQIFFYIGGVLSAALYSRRLFLLPSLGPILYNAFIILGGVLLSRRMGASSLAYGALAGAFYSDSSSSMRSVRRGLEHDIEFLLISTTMHFANGVRLSACL